MFAPKYKIIIHVYNTVIITIIWILLLFPPISCTFHSVFLLTVQETLEAIQRLSACLNIQPSAFSYAGIKDKKAITTQYMVVRGVTPEQ